MWITGLLYSSCRNVLLLFFLFLFSSLPLSLPLCRCRTAWPSWCVTWSRPRWEGWCRRPWSCVPVPPTRWKYWILPVAPCQETGSPSRASQVTLHVANSVVFAQCRRPVLSRHQKWLQSVCCFVFEVQNKNQQACCNSYTFVPSVKCVHTSPLGVMLHVYKQRRPTGACYFGLREENVHKSVVDLFDGNYLLPLWGCALAAAVTTNTFCCVLVARWWVQLILKGTSASRFRVRRFTERTQRGQKQVVCDWILPRTQLNYVDFLKF